MCHMQCADGLAGDAAAGANGRLEEGGRTAGQGTRQRYGTVPLLTCYVLKVEIFQMELFMGLFNMYARSFPQMRFTCKDCVTENATFHGFYVIECLRYL